MLWLQQITNLNLLVKISSCLLYLYRPVITKCYWYYAVPMHQGRNRKVDKEVSCRSNSPYGMRCYHADE